MKNNKAFTLVEIMIVVAIIGLLAALAIPNFVKAREQAQLNSILNNLRVLDGAKDQWAMEERKGTGDSTDFNTLTNYLKGGTINVVVGESYVTGKIGEPAAAVLPANIRLGSYGGGSSIFGQ